MASYQILYATVKRGPTLVRLSRSLPKIVHLYHYISFNPVLKISVKSF